MTFRTGRQRHFLTKKERQKLVQMIRNQRPQWEILREFPKLSWQKIALRFYRDGEVDGVSGRIGQVYQQPLKYTYKQSWADTEEYQQSLSTLSSISSTSLKASHHHFQDHLYV